MKTGINYVKIQGHSNLVKDMKTGAILNVDNETITKARAKKKREQVAEEELIELKNDVSDIKKMLLELTKKMVESNG